MKKIISLILALILCLGLCACGENAPAINSNSKPDTTDSEMSADTHDHEWSDATCLVPKTCKTCGATEGGVVSHSWKDATYSAPKTCTICGTTEGSKLPPVIAPDDTTAPELVSFTMDKTTVKIGDVITFTAEIKDSSTIYYAQFQFKCGADWHNVFLENVGENIYSGTLEITDSFVSGTYSISRISIEDYAGNYASPYSDATFTVSNSNSTIVIAPDDTTAPELVSFTLDKTNVKVGDVITFTAEIKDSSTIYYAEFQFKCGADWHNVFLENVGENIYSGTLEITDSFVRGTYSISWISIQDYAGNDAYPSSDAAFTVSN